MIMPDGLLPHTFVQVGGAVCYTAEVPNSNIAYRIANFLHIMRGNNELHHLSRYSEHIIENSDNLKNLRGAHGPRLRNWIGSHQLQEMINMNADIDTHEPQDTEVGAGENESEFERMDKDTSSSFVKPSGVDQLMAVFDDIQMGMGGSTLIIRDPAIDFDETDDVPDLTSITYVEKVVGGYPSLVAYANYQNIFEENFWNEAWAIALLSQVYHMMLDYTTTGVNRRLEVVFIGCHTNKDPVIGDWFKDCSGIKLPTLSHEHSNRSTFWEDLDKLQRLSDHIQGYLNPSTFSNPDVSTEQCEAALEKALINQIDDPVLSDMGKALAVWAFWTYGNESQAYAGDYEGTVLRILESMNDSFITEETKLFLMNENVPATIRMACE